MKLHILPAAEVDAFIVVVHRHGQGHLGVLLANDILVQYIANLPGRGNHVGNVRVQVFLRVVGVVQNAHAQVDALVADISARPRDDAGDLLLVLAAEGTADALSFVVFRHIQSLNSLAGLAPAITL